MGRKKKEVLVLKPFCYYCDKECDDQATLHSHQKVRHFSCPNCRRAFSTSASMSAHMLQVHKQTLTKVPNAKSGRDGLDITVYGTQGIPQAIIDQKMDHLLKQKGSSKLTRKDIKRNFGFQQAQSSQPMTPLQMIQSQQGPYMPNNGAPPPMFGAMPNTFPPQVPQPLMFGQMPPQFNPDFVGMPPPHPPPPSNLLNAAGGGYAGPNITPLPQQIPNNGPAPIPNQIFNPNPIFPPISGIGADAGGGIPLGAGEMFPNMNQIPLFGQDKSVSSLPNQLSDVVLPSSNNNSGQISATKNNIDQVTNNQSAASTKSEQKIIGQFRKADDDSKEVQMNEMKKSQKSGKEIHKSNQSLEQKKQTVKFPEIMIDLKNNEQEQEKGGPISFSFNTEEQNQFNVDKAFQSSVKQASSLFQYPKVIEDGNKPSLQEQTSSNNNEPAKLKQKNDENEEDTAIDIFQSSEPAENEPISFDIN